MTNQLPEIDPLAVLPARDGILHYLRCSNTGRPQQYVQRWCRCCWDRHLEVVPASGCAELLTFARYQRTYDARFPHPHVVAVVRLEEGVEALGVLPVTAECESLRIGDKVTLSVAAAGIPFVSPARREVNSKPSME